MLGEQATALAAVVEPLEAHHGLQMVAHLRDGLVEGDVEAPVQRARVVVAVVDGAGDFGVNDEHRAEHGEHLEVRIALIVLVDVFEAVLAVDARAASESEEFQVAEGVVADEGSEGLADHFSIDRHCSLSFHGIGFKSLRGCASVLFRSCPAGAPRRTPRNWAP